MTHRILDLLRSQQGIIHINDAQFFGSMALARSGVENMAQVIFDRHNESGIAFNLIAINL
ncbi:hypothetical protein D3C86_2069320 [compost metagenome]